ncbi:hypothetical protein SAMN05421676_1155 [Salinibacillus kushneri]|uniref:Uncharacterized protein n=1 Tax=Salinibacillus kushneri TaxID=237682 RepID=A0A1I0J139_9BACI|nr:hypothetical protein [Salinibacillus kushneri]SEU02672.1 hypothetical protein SAMN05421676_1155 [Salinibacillus kushneri]
MSDRKKEIHVKDLVIKADNVVFEPSRRRPVDPFFGPARRPEESEGESNTEVDVDVDVNVKEDDESQDHEKERRRPPFSWI